MSERRGAAGAGRDGSRLRELAELGALDGHVRAMHNSHEMSNIAPDRGHVIDAPAADWGFSTCPHPDCVLVRLAVPDPLASDTGQGWPNDLEPNEKPVLAITLDAEGDYIVRDLTRPGCICHSETTIEDAWQFYLEAKRDYDELSAVGASSAPLASSSETQGENKNKTTKI